MNLLAAIKRVFGAGRVDLESRFQFSPKWIQGSGGRFHIVRDPTDNKTYGLKIIDSEKATQFRSKFAAPFDSEARITESMTHGNIVNTFETGVTVEGQEYILMEYVSGGPLNVHLAKNGPALKRNSVNLVLQLSRALLKIHEAGFIHRDICPRNVLISKDFKTAKIFDFGLTVPNSIEYRQPKNRTGTPLYMAPEIVRRKETDLTVDIFALGITAYELISGTHPWGVEENSSKSALLFDSRPAIEIRKHVPNLNPNIASAIMWCLETDPAKRCQSMKQFLMKMGIKKAS